MRNYQTKIEKKLKIEEMNLFFGCMPDKSRLKVEECF